MKTKMIYLSACLFLILASCEQSTNTRGVDDDATTLGTDETRTDDNREGLFTTTYEDLIDGKAELEEEVMELKQERAERAKDNPAQFDSLMNTVEERLQALDTKANEFRSAVDDETRSAIKDEFDLIENEVSERIDLIKSTFDN